MIEAWNSRAAWGKAGAGWVIRGEEGRRLPAHSPVMYSNGRTPQEEGGTPPQTPSPPSSP